MSTVESKEKQLYDDMYEIDIEILNKVTVLIAASWDSNTLKSEIETLMKSYDKVNDEINELETKNITPDKQENKN
jgi:hypothetical protein